MSNLTPPKTFPNKVRTQRMDLWTALLLYRICPEFRRRYRLMPRGRKQRSKSSPQRTSRGRNKIQLLSRQTEDPSSSHGPRRSARIAASTAQRDRRPPLDQNTMLDIYRRSHLSTFEPRHRAAYRGQIRRTRQREESTRHTSDHASASLRDASRRLIDTSSSYGYALDFVVSPPEEVELGTPISQEVTLQVRAVQPQLLSPGLDDTLHQYFAVVALVSSDDQSATPQGTLTGPTLANSIEAPALATPTSDVMGYVTFPHLTVQKPGNYNLRVTLMRLGGFGSNDQRAITLQTVDSPQMHVSYDA